MAKTSTPIESELVRSLATLLDETRLSEIEYEAGGLRIRVARQGAPIGTVLPPVPVPPAAPPPAAPAAVDLAAHPGAVKSPMVGVVYLSPEPGSPRFANIGDTVAEGQTLLLIEAMKTFNPIRATHGGKVTAVLVHDGQPVEFGEPLVIVE
jgi:acetyl-CoA carboxylase biotin carboxyl carrier protein